MGKTENKKENRVNKLDLARRIYSKNKEIELQAINDFIDIICNEILEVVFEEKKEIFLNKLVSIKLKKVDKKGYDFKLHKYTVDGKCYKLCIKALTYMRNQVAKINSQIKDEK